MRLALILVQLPTALMVLYLDVLTIAATLWRRAPLRATPRSRFAILVPAHNEEVLLPRLLGSCAELTYPRDLYDVHVVADNCTDHTAVVAGRAGAIVHRRHDLQLQGKGHALRWLLSQISGSGATYDAYVILDADSVVSANFLDVMNAYLLRGDQAIQSYYGVLTTGRTWPEALRYVAMALFNDLRPRGRDALGLSAGLHGNGMCFAAPLLERVGWAAFTLAEDVEFHLHLVSRGSRVTYAPDAVVLAEMPTSLRQARSQNVRWERGRLQVLRSWGLRMLAQGVQTRDAVRLEALAEQVVPPFSVLTGVTTVTFAVTSLLGLRAARSLAAIVLLGQAAYVITGLRLVRARPRAYLALLWAPLYMVWKTGVYLIAVMGINNGRWIRTPRSSGNSEAVPTPLLCSEVVPGEVPVPEEQVR